MKLFLRRTAMFVALGIATPAWAEPAENKSLPAPATGQVDFARDVRPIFVQMCQSCHGPEKQRGGLRLDLKSAALKGGDSGPAIVPGKSADSPLIRLVAGMDADAVMPPKGPRLTPTQVGLLRAWIDQGAAWPETAAAKDERAGPWWSLQTLRRPAVPKVDDPDRWQRNVIDAFVLAKLREVKLTPSPEADRRTLIRRLSFDLTGLPPTPEEAEAFERDPAPDAYERLVDRLLASPHYGERWARHWLDVVHYGETHGYDKDQPRPNAWPYRDYVIRAFNADRPYGRFIEEQVAGDVLFPGTVDGVEALGFLAAGPWDLIGHVEVPESRIDGKITRHLDRDDMVTTTIGTFNSLTVGCAQCHNHKFDPISAEDYYRLHAVFAALDRADRKYDADPAVALRRHDLETRRRPLAEQVRTLEKELTGRGGPELAALDGRTAAASRGKDAPRAPQFGYHSGFAPDASQVKWVQVDLGRSVAVDRVELVGCHDDFNSIGAGFGFPVRYRVELSDDPAFERGVQVVGDRSSRDTTNPGTEPQGFAAGGRTGRYVRVTATKLAYRLNDYIFALAELRVLDAVGRDVAQRRPVTALDTIEAQPRWSTKNLVDGITYAASTVEELERLTREREALVGRLAAAAPDLAERLARAKSELADVQAALGKLPPQRVMYTGTVHTGSGAFAGTGAAGGRPRPIHVLARGDVRKPGKEVGPGALSAVADLPARFDLPPDHREGDRRAALAKWLSDPRNPLTWRSIANRVWLYHVGRGIVDTPNDFGRMGQLPTHPALLDWLAAEVRDGGGSLKALHRLIVTSATYRQCSENRPDAAAVDAGNQFYWRMARRKLEAEAVRDSLLAVSGKLHLTMGGPSFRDFVIERPEHSPHYKYELHDPEDPASHRRSVYRFIVRSQQQPFLATLDCADPSLAVEKRNATITPQQALALLNNQLALAMAKHFAARVTAAEPDPDRQAALAFRLALGRSPTTTEAATLADYRRTHGLPNLCRVVLNLNEFVFVD